MGTTIKNLILISMLLIIQSCDLNEPLYGPPLAYHKLPDDFPLKVGTGWVYRTNYYSNSNMTIDSSFTDTLLITGQTNQHTEYFLYSWNPDVYASIICNVNNLLINVGQINYYADRNDTIIFNKPYIWTFYNIDTGYVNFNNYGNNYEYIYDSILVSIDSGKIFFNERFDTYIFNEISMNQPSLNRFQYSNELGFILWQYIKPGSSIIGKDIRLIEVIEDHKYQLKTNEQRFVKTAKPIKLLTQPDEAL